MAFVETLKRPFTAWFPEAPSGRAEGLSTFSGVYLPSVLQMLGVILFMRLGWITGHIGPWKMSLIIAMSSTILLITGLSLTSIVTNMRVGSGGSYYIISRSLGVEFGSAIGMLLSIAQLTTIAICVSGFAISLREVFPTFSLTSIELYTILALTIVSSFPVDFALKAQGIIYVIVLSAILSVFMGGGDLIPPTFEALETLPTLTFWPAFALFFPAATGIESGMAMSGDLKNPSRSLAIGTLAAILTAYLVYASLSLFLSNQVSAHLLRSYPLIIHSVSKYGILFILGVWGATLSSALGGLLTAPRTLQALAKDKILPSFLSRGHGKINHPRAASALIIMLATLLLLFIDMNHLLPILSMVCLITYGLLNFVAFFESLLKNPSWRPLFKTHFLVPLSGTVACLMSMFMINAGASFISLFLVGALCFWTAKRKLKGNWDDIRYSIFSFFASTATNKLVHIKKNPKSWRPNILAIVDPSLKETNTIHFAHLLNQSKGFLTYGATSDPNKLSIEKTREDFAAYFLKKDIPCFYHLNAHEESVLGNHQIVQNYGLGPLQPNTIILKAPQKLEKMSSLSESIIETFKLQKNIVLLKIDEEDASFHEEKNDKHIDLWWGGKYHNNFELILALAHIMQHDKTYLGAKITIKTLVKNEAAKDYVTKLFQKYTKVLRFKNLSFRPYLDKTNDFSSHIANYSADATLTFLGLRPPEPKETLKEYESYLKTLLNKTDKIPAIAYVLAGEKLNFQRIFR